MTEEEALREARRRWGPKAEVEDRVRLKHPYDFEKLGIRYMVATAPAEEERLLATGSSWEEAFEQATKAEEMWAHDRHLWLHI